MFYIEKIKNKLFRTQDLTKSVKRGLGEATAMYFDAETEKVSEVTQTSYFLNKSE